MITKQMPAPEPDDNEDYSSQVTVKMYTVDLAPHVLEAQMLVPVCPMCAMGMEATLGAWDFRRDPLGICQRHLQALSWMNDEEYDTAMDVQMHAVYRWMHPFER